jgi:CxxC motif-containing protein
LRREIKMESSNMNKVRELTCIVCPRGCSLKVTFTEDGKIGTITGNACKRGVTYAENECTHPRRTVTSTVRLASGGVVAVKTADTVPKEDTFRVMKEINGVTAPADVKIGDVIIENVAGTGVKVVATANAPKA